jgi:hypothetical protein
VAVPSRGQGYHYAWKAEKTVPLLEQAGHGLVFPLPSDLVDTPVLHGPFTHRRRVSGGYEVNNADGTVAALVPGGPQAEKLVAVMNAAHRIGYLGGRQPTP